MKRKAKGRREGSALRRPHAGCRRFAGTTKLLLRVSKQVIPHSAFRIRSFDSAFRITHSAFGAGGYSS